MPGFNITPDSCHDEYAASSEASYEGASYRIETGRSHRYKFEVFEPFTDLAGPGILLYLARCSRPSVEIEEIVIHNGQDEIYRPGKNKWKPVEFVFYEVHSNPDGVIKNLTAELMYKYWAEKTVNIRNSTVGSPTEYAADAQLDLLNGEGKRTWTYKLYTCWPTSISASDLDYSNSEISKITSTLRYNKAEELLQ